MNEKFKISVQNLSVRYGTREAIGGINIDIAANKVTALIGVSGCGKSTLLRCFNRMNDYTTDCHVTGSVELDGVNIYSKGVDPVLLRKRVGLVSQKPTPFPMSIYDNVAYGPRLHKLFKTKSELDEIVKHSLESSGLYSEVVGRIYDDAAVLSGGQQQRLCIARAIAVNPEVLLMDEPCSALDRFSSGTIDRLIIELKKKFTIILVTHSVQQAGKVSDDVAFLSNGQLVESGSTQEVLTSPKETQTIEYVKCHLE